MPLKKKIAGTAGAGIRSRSGRQKVAQVEDDCCLNRTRGGHGSERLDPDWIHLKNQGLAKGPKAS